MSRINIDDKLWADARFDALKNILGNELLAIGMAVKSFRIAQEYWKTETQLVPFEIWDLYNFSALEKVGLAERCDGGIYVKGSHEQFDWLKKRQDAGRLGGQKSAKVRQEKYGTAQPQPNVCLEASPNQAPKDSFDKFEAPPNPPSPPPSPPLFSIHTDSQNQPKNAKPKKKAKEPKPKKESSGAYEVIARYCELFEQKYQAKAKISGIDAGCLSRIAKSNGMEQGIKIVETYFAMNDSWISQQCYPASLIEKNLNKILVYLKRTENSAQFDYGIKPLTSGEE